MKKVSAKQVVVFGLAVAAALGLVSWGFAALRAEMGGGGRLIGGKEGVTETFGGLGLEISKVDGSITVVGTLDGTPADRAGVRAGDRVVKVDGEPVRDDADIADVVSKLRGKPGTEVTITVARGDETKTFTITREKIKAPGPRIRVIKGQKPSFGERQPEEFWPFGEDWPWAWRGDKKALEEYREALRRLREARKKLWGSVPQPAPFWEWDFPAMRRFGQWDFPEEPFSRFTVPKRQPKPKEFRMDMDVQKTDDAITIKCDMPGMKKDDIEVSLKGNVLTVTGERSVEEETKNKKGGIVRRERRFGSFSRSFTIPDKTKAEDIKTSYKDGVLTIVIPKEKPKPKPKEEKKIRIKVGTI